MKKILLIIAVILVIVSAFRIVSYRNKSGKKEIKVAVVPVETAKVVKIDLWEKLELTGDIHGFLEAKIFSRVPGKIHGRVRQEGEIVEKNETILTVDRDEPALEFTLAEVKSPLAGVITRYFVNEGEFVSPSVVVAEVASVTKIKVLVQVAEKDLTSLRVAQRVRFYADSYPGMSFEGKIANISQSLDSFTRTSSVEIVADNAKRLLKPGMFARAEIFVSLHRNALVIPRKSVIFSPSGENTVFVVANGTAQRRAVKTGIEDAETVETLSGISAGEDVVTLGQYNLSEGSKVSVFVDDLRVSEK